MNKVRASKAVPVILLFGMLAASAATGYPAVDDDGYTPRGARALIFVVETFGTDHFGATGGAAFFAVLGVLLAGLAVMEPRRESDKSFARPLSATAKPPRRDNEAPVRRPPPNAPRLRTISARTFISSAPDAGRPSPPPRRRTKP